MDLSNQSEEENTVGEAEEDRISKLPDPLIHHILSFLPDIKHVARISVLSKRWSHIWTSVPILDLFFWEPCDPPPLSEINKFMDFVDRIWLLHDASTIQRCTLSLYSDMNASRVHSWIEHLTRRCNVEEVRLHLYSDQDIPLYVPLSLLTCESLIKLDITVCPSMHFPKKIFLPKLKRLTLSDVQFGDGCWNEEPFSSCPVLEELFLENCSWSGITKFNIITPVLKVLKMINDEFEDDEGLKGCVLKIRAPSLVSLICRGNLAKDYDLSSFLALDKAVGGFFSHTESRTSHAVSRFLQAVSHVRCLSLYVVTEQVSVPYDFVNNLPTFPNLNSLSLGYGAITELFALLKAAPNVKCLEFYEASLDVVNKTVSAPYDFFDNLPTFPNLNELVLRTTTNKILFALLKAAPNVKCLEFPEFDNTSCDDKREIDETENLFRHLQIVRHLQFVRFWQFKGEASELSWAKLILKNAKSLETMTIAYTPLYSHAKNKEVVTSELECLPRASARCVVKVK